MWSGSGELLQQQEQRERHDNYHEQEEEEIILDVDADGRIVGPTGLDFRTRWAKLMNNPASVVVAREAIIRLDAVDRAHEGLLDASNWLSCEAMVTPRNQHEALAARVFGLHTSSASFDRSRSGAEWWFQVRELEDNETATGRTNASAAASADVKTDSGNMGPVSRNVAQSMSAPAEVGHRTATVSEGDVAKEVLEGIPWHWDKDEVAAAGFGAWVFPQLSTVTYLSNVGGPTAVVPIRRPHDGVLK
jgi:hypothetical protein